MTRRDTVGFQVPALVPRYVDGIAICAAVAHCEAAGYRRGHCGAHFMDVWRTGQLIRPAVSRTCGTCGKSLVGVGSSAKRKWCSERCLTLHRRYAMTPEQFRRYESAEVCDACGQPSPSLHVDHCHQTSAMRGFLDAACNQSLGIAGDSADLLNALADYLETHPGMEVGRIDSFDAQPAECEECGAPKRQRHLPGRRPVRYCGPVCQGRATGRIRRYRLQPRQYRHLVAAQGGVCGGCLSGFEADGNRRAVVDHGHKSGLIRGVVHDSCNLITGFSGMTVRA